MFFSEGAYAFLQLLWIVVFGFIERVEAVNRTERFRHFIVVA
jgi:hypothetical protein